MESSKKKQKTDTDITEPSDGDSLNVKKVCVTGGTGFLVTVVNMKKIKSVMKI